MLGIAENGTIVNNLELFLLFSCCCFYFIMVVHCFPCQRWAVISKTQMKNTKKAFNREQMKNDAKDKKEVCSSI